MIARGWDIQIDVNWWLSLGFHVDHSDPSITLHLPGVTVTIGRCKQPGFRHSLARWLRRRLRAQRWRGHEIAYRRGAWVYVDTGTPVADARRECGHCGAPDTAEGHDACLGTLPGVMNACCGHGTDVEAYVQYEDGRIERGERALGLMMQAREPEIRPTLFDDEPGGGVCHCLNPEGPVCDDCPEINPRCYCHRPDLPACPDCPFPAAEAEDASL